MKKAIYVIGALVAVFFAFGFAKSSTPEGKERARQRAVIAACWDGQSSKAIGPGEAQFIANTCESKEREFSARWGMNP